MRLETYQRSLIIVSTYDDFEMEEILLNLSVHRIVDPTFDVFAGYLDIYDIRIVAYAIKLLTFA